jgi:hypothetical protein
MRSACDRIEEASAMIAEMLVLIALLMPVQTLQAPLASLALGQALPLPTRFEFAEGDLRRLLPADGTLIQQGTISKEYIGLSLGHEVRATGKRVFVSPKRIGARGVVFRDGYIELNIGAHGEKEEKVAFLKPTFAVDLGATAKLKIDDNLNTSVDVTWRYVQGDNLGGKLVVEFAKGRLKEAAEREARRFAAGLGDKIRRQLPPGVKVKVHIRPGQVEIVRQ